MEDNGSSFKMRAHWDYDKAHNKAFLSELVNKIFQKNNELFQFDEVKHMLSPHGMAYRGVKTIPVDKVVGSEGRYQDFDRNFMPLASHNRERWENIDMAKMKDLNLPPISVYKIGEFYFVKDGNHRVSVARELKQIYIDAEVVELFTRVKLDEISEKDLLIAESHKYFLEETHFDEIIKNVQIKLTNPWGYYRLIEHIETYGYLLGEAEHRELPWEESVRRWYHDLYMKVTNLIKKRHIMRRFPEREPGDLFIWIMDHWHYLKKKMSTVSLDHAIDDYSRRFGKKSFLEWIASIKNLFGGKDKS